MNKIMNIRGCSFKRTVKSKWEYGIILNCDLIIDMDGKYVDKIHTFEDKMRDLCITYKPSKSE
jgi:hypothetical protein